MCHAIFEHGDGRVAIAGIDEGIFAFRRIAGEPGCSGLGIGINETLRQEHRFRGFAKLAAPRAAVHQIGLGAEFRDGTGQTAVSNTRDRNGIAVDWADNTSLAVSLA